MLKKVADDAEGLFEECAEYSPYEECLANEYCHCCNSDCDGTQCKWRYEDDVKKLPVLVFVILNLHQLSYQTLIRCFVIMIFAFNGKDCICTKSDIWCRLTSSFILISPFHFSDSMRFLLSHHIPLQKANIRTAYVTDKHLCTSQRCCHLLYVLIAAERAWLQS